MTGNTQEAVGRNFSMAAMQYARDMTWQAVRRIAAAIGPGMRESQAHARGEEILRDMGMDRIWHPTRPFGAFYEDLLA